MSHAAPLDYSPDELRTAVARLLADRYLNAAIAQAMLTHPGLAEIGEIIGSACAPGGEADRVIEELRSPASAQAYVRRLLRRFSPFAEILAEVLPRGTWRPVGIAGRREFTPYPPPASEERA